MTLLKRIEARLADPELNANFNREVSRELSERKAKVTPLKVTKFVGETKVEKENKKLLRIIKGDN